MRLSFLEHLDKLRGRLIRSAAFVFVALYGVSIFVAWLCARPRAVAP